KMQNFSYELLLLLAEAEATVVPGQTPRERDERLLKAIARLDRAFRLNVSTQAYHVYKARYMSTLGREEEAQEQRRLAIAQEPTSALDWFLSGNEKLKGGNAQGARKDLE